MILGASGSSPFEGLLRRREPEDVVIVQVRNDTAKARQWIVGFRDQEAPRVGGQERGPAHPVFVLLSAFLGGYTDKIASCRSGRRRSTRDLSLVSAGGCRPIGRRGRQRPQTDGRYRGHP